MQRAIIEPRNYLERPPISWFLSLFGIFQEKQRIHKIRNQMAIKWGFEHNLWSAVEAGEETAISYFEKWNSNIIETVPKDKLLIYNVQQGWKPLAKFLNITVPVEANFPKLNDGDTVQTLVKGTYWILVGIGGFLLISTLKLRRRLLDRLFMKIICLFLFCFIFLGCLFLYFMKRYNNVKYSPIYSNTFS